MIELIPAPAAAATAAAMPLFRVCGPRFNAFVPSTQRGEEPCRFFQIALRAPLPSRRRSIEEDVERWDGMA
jgi:hypothetical protein